MQISFELFPPKTQAMAAQLWETVQRLKPLGPQFVSVTYGAGGSTRKRTHDTVARIQRESGLDAAAHLTCVGATQEQIDEVARAYWQAGIRHIIALRGDPPDGIGERYTPWPEGYAYANHLVTGLRQVANFEISVAAYPEKHPEALNFEEDIWNLKRKIDAGASRAITQFFFDPNSYFRFMDKVRAAGIREPIVPGIMPIGNFEKIRSFAEACGTGVPEWLASRFRGVAPGSPTAHRLGVESCVELCARLAEEGVEEFHFYTLNRADLTEAVWTQLVTEPSQTRKTSAGVLEHNRLR